VRNGKITKYGYGEERAKKNNLSVGRGERRGKCKLKKGLSIAHGRRGAKHLE